jgi:hypothetical protein
VELEEGLKTGREQARMQVGGLGPQAGLLGLRTAFLMAGRRSNCPLMSKGRVPSRDDHNARG